MENPEKNHTGRLRRFNNALSAIIVLLSLYILATPWLPELDFWWRNKTGSQPELVRAEKANTEVNYPKDNTLVIPALNMQELIHEGNGEDVLMKGIWHRPQTGSPDKPGNTVLAGHRFTYSNPAVFYHLDKVKMGDEIIVYWQSKKYVYQVTGIYEVSPSAVEVEKATAEPKLTLYTCTPLWTSKNRLVIEAGLKEGT
jgi:sortase A